MTTPPQHKLTHEHFAEDVEEQVDPHGFAKGHSHGHVILSIFTLRSVLAVLLIFTVMTVFFAQGEKWVASTFDVTVPHWVNVAVAMSIATIKSVIVALFFMQLKYDNPINSAIFMFCLLALGLFMGFTALDLGLRDQVYVYKAGEVQQGGLGNIQRYEKHAGPDKVTVTGPLYKFPAEQLKERVGSQRFEEIRHDILKHRHHGPAARPTGSTPNQSRPRIEMTPGLLDQAGPAHEGESGHGSGH